MEHKQFPEQEPEDMFSADSTQLPVEPEPLDSAPVIEELSFEPEASPAEEMPVAQDMISNVAEPSAPEEDPAILEVSAEEKPSPAEEETPVSRGDSFMNRIPDVDADYPALDLPDASDLPEPAIAQETAVDEELLEIQNILRHSKDEPSLDYSIPEDSILHLSEESTPAEDTLDEAYRDNGQDFDAMFTAPAPQEEKPKPDVQRPANKGRPKRKKGEGLFGIPNILATVVWLALIVAIGVTAGRMLWVCAADVLAFGREDKVVTITIYEADTMEDIIDKLHAGGLIRYKSLFSLYADISDAEEDIQPGIYDLNTRYDYHALVNFMSPRSSREVITLTIPEGYSSKQIFALLEENRICTAVDLGAYAADGELNEYWFLENLERGSENALEGFLFPDTYEFYKNSTPREALQKMLDNFNTRFTEEMRMQIETLNANVTGGGYTVREVAIVASLIEKESAAPSESAAIAGVIYNRLFNWDYPAYLNIDAAIVYAQGGDAEHIDTSLDSPYNTYTHIGLTPTPIANPGLSSLQAALNPEAHNYYFYVLNPSTGTHQFSTTQEEHDAWINSFYNN